MKNRTHKVYQTINQSDKRYIIGKLLAPPPCLRIYYPVDRPNSVGLRRSSARQSLGINMRTNSQQHRLPK